MFGNALGWSISVMMVLVTAGTLYELSRPPGESRPAGLIKGTDQPIKLPVDPATIVPPGQTDCDAGTLYRSAIEEYWKDPKPYERAASSPPSELTAIPLIL